MKCDILPRGERWCSAKFVFSRASFAYNFDSISLKLRSNNLGHGVGNTLLNVFDYAYDLLRIDIDDRNL